jgi:hypothetical protein
MNRRKGEITDPTFSVSGRIIVALPAEKALGVKNSEVVHRVAVSLSAAPLTYSPDGYFEGPLLAAEWAAVEELHSQVSPNRKSGAAFVSLRSTRSPTSARESVITGQGISRERVMRQPWNKNFSNGLAVCTHR